MRERKRPDQESENVKKDTRRKKVGAFFEFFRKSVYIMHITF